MTPSGTLYPTIPCWTTEYIEVPGKPTTNRGSTPTDSPVAIDASSKRPVKDNVTASDSKPNPNKSSGGDLFIVDNSDAEWKVRR